MSIPSIELNTGARIPQLGLGTWPLDDAQVADAVEAAASLGYRHIDTATRYGNEAGVGEGIRRTGIPREEFFVTTKLDGEFQGDGKAVGGLQAALDRMRLDYVDLLLMHWPLPKRGLFVDTWRTFESLHADGRARAIGVSNFRPEHLDTLLAETDVVPAVNQIQLNPHITRPAQRAYDAEHGIVTESWSPLGGQGAGVLREPVVVELAERLGRTPAQVVLAWHVRQGLVAIPKSATPERMRDNLAIFDLELDEAALAALATLSKGPDAGVDSNVDGH
ncbi:aldo/keto reductase [Protaetiibacter mangrovi]|uniref:Aldo/keto reductase n=1 Tax=Protaetiibacter mangrovi TaxID=2970926 RepID=A0ABT1ZH34_9MICO|nr:aldo/keto reductase [Protaetiibacter mangrovi]MCS0500000.1 aldo/keto reductase [Protaetiibacter mangrovi]TPX05419.1 aldo/keto reductase [Schumannella luteola]